MSHDQFSELADRMEARRRADRLADLRSAGLRARSGCIAVLPDDYDRDAVQDTRDMQYLEYLAGQMDPRD